MIVMKVAYHVDDEFETTDGFGIIDLVIDGKDIVVSAIRMTISKMISSGRTLIFPNRIIINKISIILIIYQMQNYKMLIQYMYEISTIKSVMPKNIA